MSVKRFSVSLLLIVCILLSPFGAATAHADTSRDLTRETSLAWSLKALGLFQGVSDTDTDFALDRAPSRAEALVMLLRLMGCEKEAGSYAQPHPFQDTTSYCWADPYIAYAYDRGLTCGMTATTFGGNLAADARTYVTFVLRALGYTEGTDGDFNWDSPFLLARRLHLLPNYAQTYHFLRGDVISISYAALGTPCKDGSGTLAETLVAGGTLTVDALERYYDAAAGESGRLSATVRRNVDKFMQPYRVNDGIDITGLPIRNCGAVIQIGDAGYETYGFYANGMNTMAEQMRNAAAAVGDKGRVFSIVVPNRLGALLKPEDFSRLCFSSKNETDAIAYAYEQMGSTVHTVDAMSELRVHNDEYIYFRTDHHWTGLGAYYAYLAWTEEAGVEPVSLDSFSTLEMPGHLGLFHSVCGSPAEMTQNPDTVIAYIPPDINSIHVEIQEFGGWTHAGQLIYDYRNSAYKYGTFIGGDHPLTTITNDNIKDDSACVLVKDSYGNPFSVYLTQHYHTVYVIDYRQYCNVYPHFTFSGFAEERGVTDFIVLLPMTLSQADSTVMFLRSYCQ